MGVSGAAWASVATYAVFSGLGLVLYRRIDRFEYPLARCAVVLLAMIITYQALQAASALGLPTVWSLAVGAVVWAGWAVALLHPLLKKPLTLRAAASTS